MQGISEITLKVLLYPKYYQNAIILLQVKKVLKRYLNKVLWLKSKRRTTQTQHTHTDEGRSCSDQVYMGHQEEHTIVVKCMKYGTASNILICMGGGFNRKYKPL